MGTARQKGELKMLEVKGTRELAKRLRKDIDKIKGSIAGTHQNLVRRMFQDLVAHTPQWSGDLAAHWAIEFHGKKAPEPFTQGLGRVVKEPYQMRSEPTVSRTLARELTKIPEIRYNSIVTFVNKMPYAEMVQAGVGPYNPKIGDYREIRDENKLFGKVAMVAYLDAKYQNKSEIRKALVKR